MPYPVPDIRNVTKPGGIAVHVDFGAGFAHLGNIDITKLSVDPKNEDFEFESQLSGEMRLADSFISKRRESYKLALQEVTPEHLQHFYLGGDLETVGEGSAAAVDQKLILAGELPASLGKYGISAVTVRQFLDPLLGPLVLDISEVEHAAKKAGIGDPITVVVEGKWRGAIEEASVCGILGDVSQQDSIVEVLDGFCEFVSLLLCHCHASPLKWFSMPICLTAGSCRRSCALHRAKSRAFRGELRSQDDSILNQMPTRVTKRCNTPHGRRQPQAVRPGSSYRDPGALPGPQAVRPGRPNRDPGDLTAPPGRSPGPCAVRRRCPGLQRHVSRPRL